MDKRLQAVAIQLVNAVAESKPDENISYSMNITKGYLKHFDFAIDMWNGDDSDPEIIKCKTYMFRDSESDTAIAKKVVEITNIINGEINPFEEEKRERN